MRRLDALVLVLAAALWSGCGGCDDGGGGGDGGPDGGVEEPCVPEVALESEGGSSTSKEVEVRFTVSGCSRVEPYVRREGEIYEPATSLGDDLYRRWVALEPGENPLTVVTFTNGDVETEIGELSFTYTPTAPEAGPESATIVGEVHTVDDPSPITGALVYLRGVPGELTTDASGGFSFPTPGPGTFVVTVEAEGHTWAQRRVSVTAEAVARVDDVHLVPLDSASAEVTPDDGGTLESSAGDISLEVPPGAVRAAFDISGVSFPEARTLPQQLPDSSRWTQAFDLHPDGVRLDEPAQIRVRNELGFPAGTAVPIGYYNRDTASWEPESMGVVSDDGEWIEAEVRHFSSFDCNFPTYEGDRPGAGRSRRDPCKNGRRGASIIDDWTGGLTLFVPVSVVAERNDERRFRLVYSSENAAPAPAVVMPLNLGSADGIERVRASVDLGGVRHELALDAESPSARYVLGTRFTETESFLSPLATGIYPAGLRLVAEIRPTYMTAPRFGAPGVEDTGVQTRDLVPLESRQTVAVEVVDDRESPMGAGWRFEGEERLHEVPELEAVVWQRAGRTTVFPYGLPNDQVARFNCFTYLNRLNDFHLLDDGRVLLVGQIQVNLAESPEAAEEAPLHVEVPSGVSGSALVGDELVILDGERLVHWIGLDGTTRYTADLAELLLASDEGLSDDTIRGVGSMGAFAADRDGVVYTSLPTVGLVAVSVRDQEASVEIIPLLELPVTGEGALTQDVAAIAYSHDEHALYLLEPWSGVIQRYDLTARNESTFVATSGMDEYRSTTYADALSMSPDGRLHFSAGGEYGYVHPSGLLVTLSAYDQGLLALRDCAVRSIRFEADGTPMVLCNEREPVFPTHQLLRASPDEAQSWVSEDVLTRTSDGYRIVGQGHVSEFDGSGRLIRRTTDDGEETLSYDGDVLTEYVDPMGFSLLFGYDAGGRLSSVTDSAGRATAVEVDGEGDLVSLTDGDGVELTFAYDGHRMTSRSSTAGSVGYLWDEQGSVAQADLGDGRTRRYRSLLQAAGTAGLVSFEEGAATMTDGDGATDSRWYDELGRLAATESGGVRWDYEYEVAISVPEVPVFTVVRATTSLGETFEVELADGLPRDLTYQDRTLLTVRRELDGRPNDMFGPSGQCSFEYHEGEERVASASCSGSYFEYTYVDDDDLPEVITDFDWNEWHLTYDAFGNLSTVTVPGGGVMTYERDDAGLLTAFEDCRSSRTEIGYTASGQVATITDDEGGTATFEHAAALTCEGCSEHREDVPARIVDAASRSWDLEVRADGQIASVTNPLGQTRTYSYDESGFFSGAAGHGATGYSSERDGAGRPISMTIGSETATYEHDARGRLTSAVAGPISITRAYDDDTFGVTETVTSSETGTTTTVSWVQRPDDAMISELTSSVGHDYEVNLPNTWQFAGWMARSSFTGDVSVSHDGQGSVDAREVYTTSDERVVDTDLWHDELHRISEWYSYMGVDDWDYDGCLFDYEGCSSLISSMTCADGDGYPTVTYSYDGRGWLTGFSATYPGGRSHSATYGYDAGGRLTSHSDLGTLGYDAAGRLQSTSQATYVYEARGTRASRTDTGSGEVRRYLFDDAERLVAVEKYASAAASSPFSTTTLSYDPLWRLATVDVDGDRSHLVWLGTILLAELDDVGDPIRRYVPTDGLDRVPVVEIDGTSYYATEDYLGTVHRLVDASGTVVALYDYDPWGRILYSEGIHADQPRRFTGAYYVESIGLYYLRARWYDPEVGQFVSEDPLFLLTPYPHQYGYADNDPVNRLDSTGTSPTDAVFGPGESGLRTGSQFAPGRAGPILGGLDATRTFANGLDGYTGEPVGNARAGMRNYFNLTYLDRSPAMRKLGNDFFDFSANGLDRLRMNRESRRRRDPCDPWASWRRGGTVRRGSLLGNRP